MQSFKIVAYLLLGYFWLVAEGEGGFVDPKAKWTIADTSKFPYPAWSKPNCANCRKHMPIRRFDKMTIRHVFQSLSMRLAEGNAALNGTPSFPDPEVGGQE